MMKWVTYAIGAAAALGVALWLWRRANPAPTVAQQYTTETDRSKVTVGPAVIRTMSEKKDWDDALRFADTLPYDKPRSAP